MIDLLKLKEEFIWISISLVKGIYQDNESHFQVPGPTYYEPKSQYLKRCFNLNQKDFIFTNSVPYKTIGGNIPKNNDNI